MKLISKRPMALTLAGLLLAGTAYAATDAALDSHVMNTLAACQRVSTSCANDTKNALGILVFPAVVKADVIIGGAGGSGALIENGKITGYYSIGAGSAGLQIGVDQSHQVYVFRTADALNELKNGSDWKVGAAAGVTVVKADANAQSANGPVDAYIFGSKGLEGGVSVDMFDVWKTGTTRPHV